MVAEHILFIEDETTAREMGVFNLRRAGYEADGAASGDEGLSRLRAERYDLVLTDVRMPGTSGLDVLRTVKQEAPEVPVLVMTAFGNVELAVQAMKDGAADFIGKPFGRDHLLLSVQKALEARRLAREVRRLRVEASGIERSIVHVSDSMRRLFDMADRVAAAETTALITGESGTGKELVARRIHVRSARAEGPFVALNCAAVPRELLESELFGHEKGAFTGAVRPRLGRFRQADGGTLFLDEVAEIPPAVQAKLLRVLQERVVDVVGRDQPIAVDVRILGATNRDLRQCVREGSFREDLFYRLNVVELNVPPLRERPEDIEALARHFAEKFARGRELAVSPVFLEALCRRHWRGNVRELENAVERAVILCPGDALDPADLPPLGRDDHARGGPPGAAADEAFLDEWPRLPPGGLSLVDLEKRVIERALALRKGSVSATARYLRIPRHILTYRMEKFGIVRQ